MQIISTDDNQVVAAVQDWHQNDSYNLYMSEAHGLFFTLALENVVSSGGPEGNVMIDLYEVCSNGLVRVPSLFVCTLPLLTRGLNLYGTDGTGVSLPCNSHASF